MTADLKNMHEMPRNRSLAYRSGFPSVVVHAARKVNAAEVIGSSAKNGWRIGWFSPKAPPPQ
jgi:hypothetical protein